MVGQNVWLDHHEWISNVVARNAEDLLRYFQRRVAHQEDAADLLGRLHLALWRDHTRVPRSEMDARMWCFGIARNLLKEHSRKSVRAIALADGLRDHLRVSSFDESGADADFEKALRIDSVRRALDTLNARSRELVMLVHWDGFTLADAARLLSINSSTARTQYRRALRHLEVRLDTDSTATGEIDRPRANARPVAPESG